MEHFSIILFGVNRVHVCLAQPGPPVFTYLHVHETATLQQKRHLLLQYGRTEKEKNNNKSKTSTFIS